MSVIGTHSGHCAKERGLVGGLFLSMVADGAGVIASRHRRLGRRLGRHRLGRHRPGRHPDRRLGRHPDCQGVSRLLLGRGVLGLARPLAAEASPVALGSLVVLELACAALRPSAALGLAFALRPSAAPELAYAALRPSAALELAYALRPSAARGLACALRPLAFPCSPPVQTSQPRSMGLSLDLLSLALEATGVRDPRETPEPCNTPARGVAATAGSP